MSYQDEHTHATPADNARQVIESENRAIKAAHDEFKALLDSLSAGDIEEAHDVTLSEAERALEIMYSLVAKLEPASKKGAAKSCKPK